jgi:plastocyanin
MTISSSVNKFRYEGNGVTDTFAFTGRIFAASDLIVEIILRADDSLVETLELTTDYTVTINGAESASVVVGSGKIPSSLQDIQVRRSLTQTQTLDLPTGTRFPAVSVENALDKITAITQDIQEQLDRKVGVPVTDSDAPPDVIQLLSDATEGAETAQTAAEAAQTAAEDAQTAAESAGAEAEAAAASLSIYKFAFDSSTTMADPGTADVRFNNATLASVTQIAVDDVSAATGNPDVSAYIASWGGASAAVKGILTITEDAGTFATFNVTGVTDNSGWSQLAVTYVDSNGTFTNGDDIYLQFARGGDDGSGLGESDNIDWTGTQTFAGTSTFNNAVIMTNDLRFPNDGELTIASGAITPTGVYHFVDTEGDAASDDLDTISSPLMGTFLS